MWRALVFLALLALAAYGAVWIADRPGAVTVTWGGYEMATSLGVAIVGVVVAAMVLAALWAFARLILNLPQRMTYASKARKRAKGFTAVSRGMVAVGSGDPIAARRHAGEAERLLGHEPLTLLLKAQAAQISGDRRAAESAFKRMMDEPETRVLGLRGLFVEARRREDHESARVYAAEAARLAPSVGWANEAVLESQCAEGSWREALATVERRASLGHSDRDGARRQRAVLLTADALTREAGEPDEATAQALEAVKLAPDLVPAAALAGRLLARKGDLKKASRILEAAWKAGPHPEIARVYLELRPGDAARDRLARAENLARISAWAPEARLAVAQTAFEARDFARARETIAPLLADGPTVRVCLLMARIESAEHGRQSGAAREWLGRAARAPRDPLWIADGVASERWAPVSPTTGRLDAFVWQAPPDVLAGPAMEVDDVVGDLDDKPRLIPSAAAAPADAAPPVSDMPLPPEAGTARHLHEEARIVAPETTPRAVPLRLAEPAAPVKPAAAPAPIRSTAQRPAPGGPVIFPVDHAPDDPGPDAAEKARSRLFG